MKGLMRRVVYSLGLVATVLILAGCELAGEVRPSVIIVAVEGLSFESLNCDDERTSGIGALCEEAVRFTHAFAPSTMSQATMASLMTGLYPMDHGVRHNGMAFLSARHNTLAEAALNRRYRTMFVSGGAPIWRKSGLAQGFEAFDDNVELSIAKPYRSADEVVRLATTWLDQNVGSSPFFVTLFMSDLQFPQIATRDEEGELRERSFNGQLAEVIESLGSLVKYLKKKRRWNRTHLIVLGTNSLDGVNPNGEPSTLTLRSTNTQVALFIKPARKERDNVIQWTVDRNISLIDVSHTLFDMLGVQSPTSSLAELQPQSLMSVLNKPEPNWPEDRLILSESGWPEWMERAGYRWAIRRNQFLYIHDRKPLIFNALTDRLENLPLKGTDPLWNSLNAGVLGLIKAARVPNFQGMTNYWIEQLEVAHDLWMTERPTRTPKGPEAWGRWYLSRALEERDWKEVKRLAHEQGEPVGVYIAGRHLGESLPMPRNPCVRLVLLTRDSREHIRECSDDRMLALYAWRTAENESDRNFAQERFLRSYGYHMLDQEIGRFNYLNDLRWDVDREWPQAPQVVDYILTLKDFAELLPKLSTLGRTEDLSL